MPEQIALVVLYPDVCGFGLSIVYQYHKDDIVIDNNDDKLTYVLRVTVPASLRSGTSSLPARAFRC